MDVWNFSSFWLLWRMLWTYANSKKRPLWSKSSEKQAQLDVAASRRRRSWSITWSFDPVRFCWPVLFGFLRKTVTWGKGWGERVFEELEAKNLFLLSRAWAGRVDCGVGVERQGRVRVVTLSHTLSAHCGAPWGSLGQERFWDGTSECLGLCFGQKYIRNFVETQSLQLKRASAGIVCSPV